MLQLCMHLSTMARASGRGRLHSARASCGSSPKCSSHQTSKPGSANVGSGPEVSEVDGVWSTGCSGGTAYSGLAGPRQRRALGEHSLHVDLFLECLSQFSRKISSECPEAFGVGITRGEQHLNETII